MNIRHCARHLAELEGAEALLDITTKARDGSSWEQASMSTFTVYYLAADSASQCRPKSASLMELISYNDLEATQTTTQRGGS